MIGGISPLGQRKTLPAVLDESALAFETILVSAGRRGLQIELSPADLVDADRCDGRCDREVAQVPHQKLAAITT